MYSLSEIVRYGAQDYLAYFSKKTGFLISESHDPHKRPVRWIWRHIVRSFDFARDFEGLTPGEHQAFYRLIDNFTYEANPDEDLLALERRAPWVFRHPDGGIFVPLEVLKLLMQENLFFNKGYLFSLLFKLSPSEQKNLASLCGNTIEGQMSISFEKNNLDMALVLYIWLASEIRAITDLREVMPVKGKVLQTPYAFAREPDDKAAEAAASHRFPSSPAPLWDYLFESFPDSRLEIDRLYTLLTKGSKGFYRAFSLLPTPSSGGGSDMVTAFKKGLLVPIIYRRRKERIKQMEIVSPHEFIRHKERHL